VILKNVGNPECSFLFFVLKGKVWKKRPPSTSGDKYSTRVDHSTPSIQELIASFVSAFLPYNEVANHQSLYLLYGRRLLQRVRVASSKSLIPEDTDLTHAKASGLETVFPVESSIFTTSGPQPTHGPYKEASYPLHLDCTVAHGSRLARDTRLRRISLEFPRCTDGDHPCDGKSHQGFNLASQVLVET